MKYLFKKAILLLIFAPFLLNAQNKVTIEKSIATLDGKQWLYVLETKISPTINYEVIKNLAGEVIAQLTFSKMSGVISFKGEFKTVALSYSISYPEGTTIQTILESYNKNQIIVNDNISAAGLEKYCLDRKIPMQKMLSNEEWAAKQKAMEDAAAKAEVKPKSTNNKSQTIESSIYVSFTLVNNSTNKVRYYIGKEPKYGSGSTNSIGGNTQTSEHGTIGEKFCIVDEHDNPISCNTITEGMGKIEINKGGNGFGN